MTDDNRNPGQIAVVDCETTGLDPATHDVWEIAAIVDDVEHTWAVRPDLTNADPNALRVNRYYQRTTHPAWRWTAAPIAAAEIARLTAGRHLAGACPWFDASFLDRFLRNHGQAPAWAHRHVCVENLAAGHLRQAVPVSLRRTAEALGIPVPEDAHHSALGDARVAKAVYDAITECKKQESAA